ncbi:hypothetical protein BD324DRAFT_583305 [Kockovaella imperatae]|uniref:Raptor N-terminal CASPase-like domain-containing protein n=1 Tax=Kockovaella imperatae TaxID=4999 RepID=A0A1Y1U959_9TREE|nr:hypothetical protein BD324DRAFT_583305 [Kockovaella imperatae]ORX34568.1 hypothetical protein BD324DRAFT_583305 [Kockovaella imperatae]
MQHTSLPGANRHRSHSPSHAYPRIASAQSERSSGFITVSNSWASTGASLSLGSGPEHLPLAWSDVRHEVDMEGNVKAPVKERSIERCSQAVLITCLHLSHEMALREVGLYAWTLPHTNDAHGSMLRIMKHPSKTTIRHHLERARYTAGSNSYVAVIYSGHGIQESPTEAGELWCYDVSFEDAIQGGPGPSEYIPIQLFDLLTWAGSSTCYVWDCQHSGRFIRAAVTEAEEIDTQLRAASAANPSVGELHPPVYARRQIHFAACGAEQTLPRAPGMPDDLFTACLTTPLRISLWFHNLQTFPLTASDANKNVQRSSGYMMALYDNMSQSLKDRLWSELQAVMHTIAWQSLDGADYQLVFGQSGDVVSSMAGGYLLSQRVMGAYRATPESIPHIPSSTSHALWTHWDLILDNLFEQLPPFRHFEQSPGDTTWESDLKLVSFMDDQLDSILQTDFSVSTVSDQGGGPSPVLFRLPIICQAALTTEFRKRACVALEACLRSLDIHGLARAVQGGALDVAAQLLVVGDPNIGPQMISIWAALVRNDACVRSLALEGRTAERLTSVPCVRFFLDSLEEHLNGQPTIVIQASAVLATIANFVAGRKAPRFTTRTLKAASGMIQHEDGLVQQWGALLAAEVLGSIEKASEVDKDTVLQLKGQLIAMAHSQAVEARATAVYALSRLIDTHPRTSMFDLVPSLDMVAPLINPALSEGSALVRKELVRLFSRILHAGGKWTLFAWIVVLLEQASDQLPEEKEACAAFVATASKRFGSGHSLRMPLARLASHARALRALLFDAHPSLAALVRQILRSEYDKLKRLFGSAWETVLQVALPIRPRKGWTADLATYVRQAGERLLDKWDTDLAGQSGLSLNNELFERSKHSLHAYLAVSNSTPAVILPDKIDGQPESSQERTWIIRHRFLEDSLVVAEQQRGLPWRWAMKDISSPDSWSTIAFHSFLNLIVACNRSREILFWDWSACKRTRSIKLDIPEYTHVTSVRFVNELQERICVVAEISNGNVLVLSGPMDDAVPLRTISSFCGLDMAEGSLVTTWWRQKGRMCIGGAAAYINVWDCPAERRERVLETRSQVALSTLITEPVSGNLVLSGFQDGIIRLFDLRQSRRTSLIEWTAGEDPIVKIGVVLGESKHVTSAW